MRRPDIQQYKRSSKAGFTLMESIIAIALLGILLACVTVMMATASRYNAAAAGQHQKVDTAYNAMEETIAASAMPEASTEIINFELKEGDVTVIDKGSAFLYGQSAGDVQFQYFRSKQLPVPAVTELNLSPTSVPDPASVSSEVEISWIPLAEEYDALCVGYRVFSIKDNVVSEIREVSGRRTNSLEIRITDREYAGATFAVVAVAEAGKGYADSPLSNETAALTIRTALSPATVDFARVETVNGVSSLQVRWTPGENLTSSNCAGYRVHIRYQDSDKADGESDWSSAVLPWEAGGYVVLGTNSMGVGGAAPDIGRCAGGTLWVEAVALHPNLNDNSFSGRETIGGTP